MSASINFNVRFRLRTMSGSGSRESSARLQAETITTQQTTQYRARERGARRLNIVGDRFSLRALAALRAMVVALAMLCATEGVAATSPVVSPEPFFRHAEYGQLKISPSGKYVAALVPANGRQGLAVIELESKQVRPLTAARGDDIVDFNWVNDERIVFTVADLQAGLGMQRGGGLFAINRDGTELRELAPTLRTQQARGQLRGRPTRLLTVLRDDSDDVLILTNESNERVPDVYRLNTRTGRRTLKTLGRPGNVYQWVADQKGVVRAASADEKGITVVYYRPNDEAPWIRLGEYGVRDARIVPVAFDGDGSLIVSSNIGRDTFALYRYDVDKRALGELLAAHPRVDLSGGLYFDREQNRVVGVLYEAEEPGVAWFDDQWARLQLAVDGVLKDRRNVISRGDGPRVLIHSFSDKDPGAYYLLDLENRKLELLIRLRPTIKPGEMPARQPVRYTARDGLEIPAYLTLPRDKQAKNLPLVLYVHGGPYVRGGHWAWRDEPAYLASLGYAVLEPEFRGSQGWGRRLLESGFKQWGRAMQDDLNDGVDWLAKQGTIDPKRACIMGASYGGYAVLMGLARDPERWRCGIDYVGVTDINLLFDVTWSDLFDSDFMRYTAREMIGDPDRDAAQFKATSPLENAGNIRAPVLMAYGAQDARVPLIHGERMRDALVKRGIDVEWVVYPQEGHGFLLEENRYDFYGRVARFLARHLGT